MLKDQQITLPVSEITELLVDSVRLKTAVKFMEKAKVGEYGLSKEQTQTLAILIEADLEKKEN